MKCLIILCALIAACNTKPSSDQNNANKSDTINQQEAYPLDIVRLGLEQWYDKTKWALYCIYCDDSVRFQKHTGIHDSITFASLDLKFENVKQFNDTTEINVFFYLRDTIKCDLETTKNSEVASGAGFKKGSDSIIYYTSTTTLSRFWKTGPGSRYENPLQPEVVAYIKSNKQKLSAWFYDEAKKRGIIQ